MLLLGECLLGDDGQTPLGRLSSEGLHQTGGVVDVGLIEHGDLTAQLVVSDIVGRGSTLCRVVEADTEGLVVALNALLGRGGTGDDEYVVVLGGGISNRGEKLAAELNEMVKGECFGHTFVKPAEVVIASLKNDAGIIGAAELC